MHQLPLTDLFQQLDASERGLSAAEARRRLARFGPNEPAPAAGPGHLRQALLLLANPLALTLLIASGVSAYLGQTASAAIIAGIVLLGAAINFVQSYHARRAAERLREHVSPTATVLRDGTWGERPRRELVPGDVIRLSAGDLVPADARLLHAKDLYAQQASLTGESIPAEKDAGDPATGGNGAIARNTVYLGTSVVSGTATAVVVATGAATAFGGVAARLADEPPETEFDRGTRQFSLFILQTVVLLVFFLFLVSAVRGRPALESLLFAIALAVGLTPEFLPMITAVTLANGALRMAREDVIVKHLAAMQNFGSIDVLCSDKTGTLTRGEMVVDQVLGPRGEPDEGVFLPAYLNSFHDTGIRSPFDTAILARASPDVSAYAKLDEVPFDFQRRRLSVVVERDGERTLITKGAPEAVLGCCTHHSNGGPAPLDDAARAACVETFRRLSAGGRRVLAVASRPVEARRAYGAADETGLTLLGLLTFTDPPRDDAAEAVAALQRDGVRVIVLTGDNELLARHVCDQVGVDTTRIVLGDEIDDMTDPALAHIAERAGLFARVSPAQKNRVIEALKRRGHVVGYLGDGVNDAPSLHAADVGISVNTAVDVAKDAAEVILLEPGLAVLHAGILEGRRAFGNVMKYLLMGTSSNFGNMFSMAVAAMFLPFLPMLPTQVLLNNFLYDLSQITIPTDNVDDSFTRKPRRWDVSLIRRFMLAVGPISSLYDLLTFWALLVVFRATEPVFHTAWFVESLATQTLVLLLIRTGGSPFESRPSLPLLLSVFAVVGVGLLLPYTPLAGPLGFVPLPPWYWAFLAVVVVTYLGMVEVAKRRLLGALFR